MPGLIRGIARTAAVVGTAQVVSGRVQRRQQGRWATQDAAAADDQTPTSEEPVASPAPVDTPDNAVDGRLSQLKQLGELRSTGVLSDAEFDVEKAKILQS
jgi:hypothetical protein